MIQIPKPRVADWQSPQFNRQTLAGSVSACVGKVSPRFRHAVEHCLREKYPEPQGELLATAVSYLPHRVYEVKLLRRLRDADSAVTLYTLLTGTANGATMRFIRSAMVSSALLGDIDAVGQWAQAGLTRCSQLGGKWPATAPQWEWVLVNCREYVELIQELARFLNPK